MKMNIHSVVLIAALSTCTAALPNNVAYRPGQCLKGDRHRELPCPQPEGPEYQACFQWSNETCCTAEFTRQLAGATVVNIDGFHWSRCDPPLSQRCEEYFRRVECFYRCSPNVAHWALDPFPSALAALPVCGNFCDQWFEACASDLTCAVNWITDWINFNGTNRCMADAVCRNFSPLGTLNNILTQANLDTKHLVYTSSEAITKCRRASVTAGPANDVYGNGTGLCNTLWGQSFVYTDQPPTDSSRTCLSLWWPLNETNPNKVALRNIFGSQVDTVTAPPCGGGHGISSCLSSSVVMAAAILGLTYLFCHV